MSTRGRLWSPIRALVIGLIVAAGLWVAPTAAHAEFVIGSPAPGGRGPATELTITGTGVGGAVAAYDGPSSMDPLDGYPSALPSGSTAHAIDWAGTIIVTDPATGTVATTYCIDLHHDTETGVNHELGTWDEGNVPNMGYVGYILHHYFPTTDQPAGSDSFKAITTQLAIWFFTDRVVLDPSSPYYATVSGIVADALANGPSPEPDTPRLEVTPAQLRAPLTGDIVGPFTVHADKPSTIHIIDGVEVFTDSSGRNRLADGDQVQPGDRLWVRTLSDTEPQGFTLEYTTDVLESTVYLYDGSNPGITEAQKLVLAQRSTLTRKALATVTPYPAGNLEITKSIKGSGAGAQGRIRLHAECTAPDGTVTGHDVTVDAHADAGDHVREIRGIDAGSTCVVSEPRDGDNDAVDVGSVTIDPETVTVAENETASVTVTDTYRARPHLPVTGPPVSIMDTSAAGSAMLIAGIGIYLLRRKRSGT